MSGREATANVSEDPKNPEALEVAPGTLHEKLEGWVPALASEEQLRQALEKAFDYRGDIALTLKNGKKIEGYIFDRRSGKSLSDSCVRLFPAGSDQRSEEHTSELQSHSFIS